MPKAQLISVMTINDTTQANSTVIAQLGQSLAKYVANLLANAGFSLRHARKSGENMKWKTIILVMGIAVVAIGLFVSHEKENRKKSIAITEMFGGEQARDIVEHPDKVEVFRLDPLPERISLDKATLADYPLSSKSVAVPETVAGQISAGLLSPVTYYWGDAKKSCGVPIFGVRLTFHRGKNRVDVLFCFKCDDLVLFQNDRLTGYKDFHPGRAIFVRAVKSLFPNDQVIQQLDEKIGG